MAFQDKLTLLSGATTTGSAVRLDSYGYWNWVTYGTFNSSSAQLQWSPDNTTFISVDGAAVTADGGFSEVPIGAGYVRVAITGTATSVNSQLDRVSR